MYNFAQVNILIFEKIEMKRLIILLTTLLCITSCKISEKPEFLRVEHIEVTESNSKTFTISAHAVFMNPNIIGGKLKTDEIKVFVNDNEMASVSTKTFDIPSEKEFSIPLTAHIPKDSIFSDKNLGSLLGSLFSKKIKVQYRGDIKYKVFGYSDTYTIDKTETIKIK